MTIRNANMTPEMIEAAHLLYTAALNYRLLYNLNHPADGVTYLKHEPTGETIFITDAFNSVIAEEALLK